MNYGAVGGGSRRSSKEVEVIPRICSNLVIIYLAGHQSPDTSTRVSSRDNLSLHIYRSQDWYSSSSAGAGACIPWWAPQDFLQLPLPYLWVPCDHLQSGSDTWEGSWLWPLARHHPGQLHLPPVGTQGLWDHHCPLHSPGLYHSDAAHTQDDSAQEDLLHPGVAVHVQGPHHVRDSPTYLRQELWVCSSAKPHHHISRAHLQGCSYRVWRRTLHEWQADLLWRLHLLWPHHGPHDGFLCG